jgi:predicted nucleotidyltransferase
VNVSSPWQTITPTLDGPVLVTLSGLTGAVTGRQVHQLTGTGSEAGIRNVLTRLVEQGVVRATPVGNAYLYAVNREHVAWPSIKAMSEIRTLLFSRLRAEFDTWSPAPHSVALYGSAARQDGDTTSDIDLLLIRQTRIGADNTTWQEQTSRLRELVTAWTGNDCQLYDINRNDLSRMAIQADPLLTSWRRDAIPIAGADIRRILRETRT